MLCTWWDKRGPVYYELLQPAETIADNRCCAQLTNLNAAIQEKRQALVNTKGVVFQNDNARPHVALVRQRKLAECGWEVLPHPPYSPLIAPLDLFQSLQNSESKNFKQYTMLIGPSLNISHQKKKNFLQEV